MRLKTQTKYPPPSDELLLWKAKNRGVLAWVAENVRPTVSEEFVCMVSTGRRHSKNGTVERLLKQKGWPGVRPQTGPIIHIHTDPVSIEVKERKQK